MSPPNEWQLHADRLVAGEIRDSLGKCVIGQRIIVLESTRSTNDFLRQMLTPDLPEGTVVFAEEQTSGRGQRANRWESAPHLGLWFSLFVRPRIPLAESARLTNWAAQAVVATLQKNFALAAIIKPPNDVYLGPGKVCGVLIETTPLPGAGFGAIVGVGLNVNHAPEDFSLPLRSRAGSIAQAVGRKINRTKLAAALLGELERTLSDQIVSPTSTNQRR